MFSKGEINMKEMYDANDTTINLMVDPADHFKYKFGYRTHKGTNNLDKKIDSCLFISNNAKCLYRHLKSYAYDSDECYPGRDTLMKLLRVKSETTFKGYMDELIKADLIELSREFGKENRYKLLPPHKSSALYNSELIYMCFFDSTTLGEWITLVDDYEDSDLFRAITSSDKPLEFKDAIVDWYSSRTGKVFEPKKEKQNPLSIKRQLAIAEGYESKQQEIPYQESKTKVKGVNRHNKDFDMWTTDDFVNHFNDTFEEATGLGGKPVPQGVRKMLDELIKTRKNKALVKEYIEIFIQNPKEFEITDMYNFCMSWNQTKLDTFKTTGKFPVKYAKGKAEKVIEVNTEIEKKKSLRWLVGGDDDDGGQV
jgi:hypothetical protein